MSASTNAECSRARAQTKRCTYAFRCKRSRWSWTRPFSCVIRWGLQGPGDVRPRSVQVVFLVPEEMWPRLGPAPCVTIGGGVMGVSFCSVGPETLRSVQRVPPGRSFTVSILSPDPDTLLFRRERWCRCIISFLLRAILPPRLEDGTKVGSHRHS